MIKKLTAFSLACIIGATAIVFSSCKNQYTKTPKDFTPPYDYDLSEYVTLGQYKGIEYTPYTIEATDEQIEKKLAEELDEYSTVEIISDRPAKLGDTLTINYAGTIDGESFEGGTATEQTITLGEGRFIEGFEDGLVGLNAGETTTLHLQFPDPYPNNPDLAGKDVDFTVLVRFIRSVTIPELTDEFVASIGDYTSAEDYRNYIKTLVEEENKESEASENKQRVWEAVYKNCEFHSVPETEVNTYIESMTSQYTAYAESESMELEEFVTTYLGTTYETFEAQIKAYAEAYVKQDLIIYSIVHVENLKLTDKEYDEGIAELAESYGTTVESLEEQADFSDLWKSIMPNKVLSFLLDNAVASAADSDTESSASTTAAE